MKIYSLNEARLMHNLGIRMRCINATRLPSFVNQDRVFMTSAARMICEDTNGKRVYSDLLIRDEYSAWVVADENQRSSTSS